MAWRAASLTSWVFSRRLAPGGLLAAVRGTFEIWVAAAGTLPLHRQHFVEGYGHLL